MITDKQYYIDKLEKMLSPGDIITTKGLGTIWRLPTNKAREMADSLECLTCCGYKTKHGFEDREYSTKKSKSLTWKYES